MIRFTPARLRRGFGSSLGGEPCPTIHTLRIPPLPGGGGFLLLPISGCRGSPFRELGAWLRAIPVLMLRIALRVAGMTGRGWALVLLAGRALRGHRARREGLGSARAMALAFSLVLPVLPIWRSARPRVPSTLLRMVPLPVSGRTLTIPGRWSGRFGFCTGWPRGATCARRRRGWG